MSIDFLCVSLRNAETEDGVNRICSCQVIMLGKISHSIKIIIYIYIYRKLSISYVKRGYNGSNKGKAVPLQAWSGPEGSRKLRFPDFMTTAKDGGKVANLTHRPPSPSGNAPGTHF